LMELLSDSIKWNAKNKDKAVFITKILPDYKAL